MFYLITKQTKSDLDTPVFEAGYLHSQEGCALFSSPDAAASFLKDRDLAESHCVAELTNVETLRWLIEADRAGIDLIVMDPSNEESTSSREERSKSLPISSLLRELADELASVLDTSVGTTLTQFEELLIYRCDRCGRVDRGSIDDTIPMCCGRTMASVAKDSRTVSV